VIIDWEGRIRGYFSALEDSGYNKLKQDLVKVVNERSAFPTDALHSNWMDERRKQQLATTKNFKVFHDFSFSDQIEKSNITFQHKIVNDVGIDYKAVHYDHGNAIAVADIDLDGLYDIYFSTQAGSNELWRNIGNGKFEDITEKSGLRLDDRIGVGASFADIDNDGDPDLYITSVRFGNQLFENNGKGIFKDITAHSGTNIIAHSSGSVFFDYNRDGLLDLFVSNVGIYTKDEIKDVSIYTQQGQINSNYQYYLGQDDAFAGHLKPDRAETSVLFKNLGNNKFEDVTEKMNISDQSWTGEVQILDANTDGWPDVYVLNMQGNDEYYENQQGKSFLRKSREIFPKTPWGSMGAKAFDYDNDGDMDLYLTDMHSDMSKDVFGTDEKLKADIAYTESFLQSGGNSIFGNAFYRNDGNGKFTEISDVIGAETYWPWGLSTGDFNADGFEDVFITAGMNLPFRYAVNSLLLNNNGEKFLDSEYVLGIEPRKGGHTAAPWYELNCSGKDNEHLGCTKASGRKVIWSALASRSSVIFDLDQDGDQDIVTLDFNQPPMLLINNLSDKKNIHYLKIKLIGTKSNRSGLGTVVKIHAGQDVYTKVQDGKSGYLSQSLLPLYFGLGDNTEISKIEVYWPSGKKQVIEQEIKLNRLFEIIEEK